MSYSSGNRTVLEEAGKRAFRKLFDEHRGALRTTSRSKIDSLRPPLQLYLPLQRMLRDIPRSAVSPVCRAARLRSANSLASRDLGTEIWNHHTMQSPQEFMEAYLSEQAEYIQWHHRQHRVFGEKFYSQERLKIPSVGYRFQAFSELLASVENSGDTALAVTNDSRTGKKWRRYHLRVRRGKWEIYNHDSRCGRCNGTGRFLERLRRHDGEWVAHNQVENCDICGGSGWLDGCKWMKPVAKEGQ